MADDAPETMTYAEAVANVPDVDLPEFWIGSLDALQDRLDDVERGHVEELAESPGGYPIHLVAYGTREPPERRANFNSAAAAQDLEAYVDRNEREKPVVFLVGPVHGAEVEGLTGVCNLLSIMETGSDLRGEERPTLRELADRCRLLVVPCGNPDGLARFEPDTVAGLSSTDRSFWGQGTWADDTLAGWPDAKKLHPMTGDDVGFLGCYFDDDGVNPMHDEFFDPMGPEAPAILDVARREAPDVTVSLHTHGYPPGFHRTKFVPLEDQAELRSIHRRYNALLADLDVPRLTLTEVAAESGRPPPYFNLVSAAYHVSGTTGVLHECPGPTEEAGGDMGEVTHEDILEAQLALYEAVFRHVLAPAEP